MTSKSRQILERVKKDGKKGFYIHGKAGVGKTYILKEVAKILNPSKKIAIVKDVVIYKDREKPTKEENEYKYYTIDGQEIKIKWKENEKWRKAQVSKMVEQNPTYKIEYMPDMMDDILQAQNEGRKIEKLNSLKERKYLFLDDLGAEENVTDFVVKTLNQILDYRNRTGKYTFITSNLKPKEVGIKYQSRIVSRTIEMCLIVELGGSDRRLESVKQMKL